MINKISKNEKDIILKNAVISFVHGIEHLVMCEDDEVNFKFAILHVFNTVELMTKAYIGSINEALLWLNIDAKSKNMVNISTLMKRMNQFSEINFKPELQDEIEKLRKHRNDIEHKRFVLNDKRNIVVTLIHIINGLIIFCKKHLSQDLNNKWNLDLEDKYHILRINYEGKYKKVIKKMEDLKSENKDVLVKKCPNCLNYTIPYKKKRAKVKCYYCNKEFILLPCEECGKYFLSETINVEDLNRCNKCEEERERYFSKERNKFYKEVEEMKKNAFKKIPNSNIE